MRAVIYARSSLDLTGKQASRRRQIEACNGLAVARGWEVVAIKQETQSAYDDDKDRPVWTEVLGMIARREVDVVIAWHLDRVTRSMVQLEKLIRVLQDSGVGIATATGDIDLTNDVGRMVARILAAVAQAEVERKAERQKLAHAQAAAEGRPSLVGSRAFGYTRDGMTIVPAEAEAVRAAAEEIISGTPLARVVASLNEAGFQTARKLPWNPTTLKRLLINPRYISVRTHNGVEVGPGLWPAILDRETFLLTVERLTDPDRASAKGGKTIEHLLSKIARCGVCEAEVQAAGTGRDGQPRYRCPEGHASAPRAALDLHVEKHMVAILSQPKFLDTLIPAGDSKGKRARAQLDKLQARLKRINAANLAGAYDEDPGEYDDAVREARKLIAEQKAILTEVGTVKTFDGFDFRDVAASWNAASFDHQRAMISAVLDVRISKRRAREAFDPELHAEVGRRG